MLKSLFLSLHNRGAVGKIVGELSEIKLVTSLLARKFKFTVNSRGKLWCFVWQETAKTTPNPKLALLSSLRIQNFEENGS